MATAEDLLPRDNDENKTSELLTIQFGVATHEVNAEAVASMIRAVTLLIQVSNKEVGSDCELSVKVRAFAPGSLEISLELIIPMGVVILEKVPLILGKAPILASVLSIIKDYFSLKKWLQGKPLPKKNDDGQYDIGDQKYEIHAETVNVYNNSQINNYVTEAFWEAHKDSTVKDVAFFKGEKKELLVNVPDTHFQHFDASTYEDIPQDRTEQTERVIVTVATPVFRGKGKWKVVYQKNIISVSITDEVFLQKAAGTVYRFGTGDKLDVDMNIKYKKDKNTDELLIDRSGFVVVTVWNHIPKPSKRKPNKQEKTDKQKTFFDSD